LAEPRRDLGRIEIEEHFEVDCRQVVLFDHAGDSNERNFALGLTMSLVEGFWAEAGAVMAAALMIKVAARRAI
jgi:hypothetical protein